jgi:aspartate racemase
MKTIGILGGLGPQATMDFEARLHAVAQRIIPQHGNSGHPPLIVYYHRRPPFMMQDERTPVFPLQPDPDLLEAARWLGTRADFLVITANGPHIIQAQIEQAAGRKVLSMIEVTLEEVQRRGWRKIGVLGFGPPNVPVYTEPLSKLSLAFELITPELQDPLNIAVMRLQEGRATAEDAQAIREAVAYLRNRQVDGIILGCTELPLLLPTHVDEPDLINPAQLLAEAAVRYAMV